MFGALRFVTLLLVVISMAVPGIFAYWQYSHLAPDPEENAIFTDLAVFDYPPEQVVPDDDLSSSLGENHLELINTIAYEESYGLNATKKPIIHNYLKKPGDVIYCNQNVQGGNLKHLMVDSSSASDKLYFVVMEISDTEYHVFTTRYSDITDNSIGTRIVAYKTVMIEENGEWSARSSYYGTAEVNDPGVVSRAIDVTTWQIIKY